MKQQVDTNIAATTMSKVDSMGRVRNGGQPVQIPYYEVLTPHQGIVPRVIWPSEVIEDTTEPWFTLEEVVRGSVAPSQVEDNVYMFVDISTLMQICRFSLVCCGELLR